MRWGSIVDVEGDVSKAQWKERASGPTENAVRTHRRKFQKDCNESFVHVTCEGYPGADKDAGEGSTFRKESSGITIAPVQCIQGGVPRTGITQECLVYWSPRISGILLVSCGGIGWGVDLGKNMAILVPLFSMDEVVDKMPW